jgi:hypothetical protein
MQDQDELKAMVIARMEKTGVMGQLKSVVRAKVYGVT